MARLGGGRRSPRLTGSLETRPGIADPHKGQPLLLPLPRQEPALVLLRQEGRGHGGKTATVRSHKYSSVCVKFAHAFTLLEVHMECPTGVPSVPWDTYGTLGTPMGRVG